MKEFKSQSTDTPGVISRVTQERFQKLFCPRVELSKNIAPKEAPYSGDL